MELVRDMCGNYWTEVICLEFGCSSFLDSGPNQNGEIVSRVLSGLYLNINNLCAAIRNCLKTHEVSHKMNG